MGILFTCVEPGGLRTGIFSEMEIAPDIEGYEVSVGQRVAQFKSDTFKAKGDPEKAAKILRQIAQHPEPPIHLLLGSDSIVRIKQAESERSVEMETWLSASLSTDAD